MTFWISVMVALAIILIISIVCIRKSKYYNGLLFGISMFSGALLFFIALLVLACWMNYIKFENSFVIQKEMYEEIAASKSPINDLYLTADIINANAELAKYQASKSIYGPFTIIPDRVLDITPIGVN